MVFFISVFAPTPSFWSLFTLKMAYLSDIETFFFEKGRSVDVFEFRGKKLSPTRKMKLKSIEDATKNVQIPRDKD